MESMAVLTHRKHGAVTTGMSNDAALKEFNKCGYVKSAYLAERFNDPASLDPSKDALVVGAGGIFTQAEYDGDREFQKTAAVMKMVIDGNAGRHNPDGRFRLSPVTLDGRVRDLRGGPVHGACLNTPRGAIVAHALCVQRRLLLRRHVDNSVERREGRVTGESGHGASFSGLQADRRICCARRR